MIPVIEIALTDPDEMCLILSIPVIPASIMRCAPANVIVSADCSSDERMDSHPVDGRRKYRLLKSQCHGGCVLKTMKRTIAIITTPGPL